MPAQKNRNRLALPQQAPAQDDAEDQHTVLRMGGSALVKHLMDPKRSKTAVVISYKSGEAFRIDAEAVAAMLGAEADVFEIPNGVETYQLERGLPERLHIFGSGARVYPHGQQWQDRVPGPHIAYRPAEIPTLCQALENEVLAAQYFELPAPKPPTTASLPVIVEAVVQGIAGSDRAMVTLAGRDDMAVIRGEDLLPGIPLDWLLGKGQALSGTLDTATNVLDIKTLLLPRPSPVTVYQQGDVALARVKSVRPTHAMVELWPGSDFRIDVNRISSNDLDSAEDLLTEGEVVRVRVAYDNGAVVLSMLDVDDDEAAVPAPPLVSGGPAWLDSGRPYASLFTVPSSGAPPIPGNNTAEVPHADGPVGTNQAGTTAGAGGAAYAAETLLTPVERRTALQTTQMQLEQARHTITELVEAQKRQGATDKVARALQDQLEAERKGSKELAKTLNELDREKDALREELARTKAALVQHKQQRRSTSSRSEAAPQQLFLIAEEQFRFELLLAWAHNVPAQEKAQNPLGEYHCSQHFLDSWAGLTEQQRRKTLRAVLDLVADRRGPMRKRDAHPLRQNEGAHAGPTMRGEDVCMRLYVEQGTAGALRLHYWKLPVGTVELHEVVTHDVVKP